MNAPVKYRKKPIVINAWLWDGSAAGSTPIIDWILQEGHTATYHEHLMDGDIVTHPDPYLLIVTLEGPISASSGDYIIQGVEGEFYPCKPTVFEKTYEEVK